MSDDKPASNFIREIIDGDLEKGTFGQKVQTRFPPEPNGYLHIGHAKAIVLNYSIANDYKGTCLLRFDDTNPIKEEQEYVDSITEDVRWLGYDVDEKIHYTSDYFETLHEYAVKLINKGLAYVDDLTAEEIRQFRGTLTEPGRESPYRNRSVDENIDLFDRMRKGEFPDGAKTLRAKIDMASGNLNFRDPVMYRILHATHHRTGSKWCIYPMYDWAHGQSDSIEGTTHSLCTTEFEDHRPLYDWFLENLDVHRPRQIEFARLNLTHTVLSKRKLIQLVNENHVSGWDDPRMPTLSGLKRRGFPPKAIRAFCKRIGVAKALSTVEVGLLEYCVREELNQTAPRVMGVLRPLKLVLTNYPEGQTEELEAENNPEDPGAGTRKLSFSRELYIERDDFMEDAPKKFFRLAPGREVRLKHAYIIKCEEAVKLDNGEVVELRCSYDPESKSGGATADRKVKGTLHWVSAPHAFDAEVRLYDHLFTEDDPEDGQKKDYIELLNPGSLETLKGCKLEPSLSKAEAGERFQFMRLGYFCVDTKDSAPGRPVFNRTVTLRDAWAKIKKKQAIKKA
ncbi:MAG TPA: glutamine--tRNA ligase/YqeY domain fusion protein [Nitrospirae bacterium]|nr:glutamine--tRNA ligase/YqeY domain fusion protein [Nitrospirota bacterium]